MGYCEKALPHNTNTSMSEYSMLIIIGVGSEDLNRIN